MRRSSHGGKSSRSHLAWADEEETLLLGDLEFKFKPIKFACEVVLVIHGHISTSSVFLPRGNVLGLIGAAILPGGMLGKVTDPAASAAVISDREGFQIRNVTKGGE